MKLHDWQQHAVDAVWDWYVETDEPFYCVASPTGTGKSFMINDMKRHADESGVSCVVISQSDDILQGIAEKSGHVGKTKYELENLGYFTPVRLRNLLLAGSIKFDLAIIDEAHHDDDTHELIGVMSGARCIGFTATPFRGTGKATVKFREKWGEPHWAVTLREAAEHQILSFPECHIVPLLDDDVIDVDAKGDFNVKSTEAQLGDIFDRVAFELHRFNYAAQPTMLSFPGVDSAKFYASELTKRGLHATAVTGETKDRESIFARVISCETILCQVRVVSEGVDLPIRLLLDLSPTMSPVKWQQQLGRITRPGGRSTYVCTNRNLLRHAYLLEGLLPPAVVAAGEKAFGPSARRSPRVIGFEGLGKFHTVDIPLKNGTTGQLLCVQHHDNGKVTQYAAVASPTHSEVLYAQRVNVRGEGDTKYERWVRINSIPELQGYASVHNGPVTPAQQKWWSSSARWYGLDSEAELTNKVFQVLPVLKDTGHRFR